MFMDQMTVKVCSGEESKKVKNQDNANKNIGGSTVAISASFLLHFKGYFRFLRFSGYP